MVRSSNERLDRPRTKRPVPLRSRDHGGRPQGRPHRHARRPRGHASTSMVCGSLAPLALPSCPALVDELPRRSRSGPWSPPRLGDGPAAGAESGAALPHGHANPESCPPTAGMERARLAGAGRTGDRGRSARRGSGIRRARPRVRLRHLLALRCRPPTPGAPMDPVVLQRRFDEIVAGFDETDRFPDS
jgi:hypothetical protein